MTFDRNFEALQNISRRHFLKESAAGLGAVVLGSLMAACNSGNQNMGPMLSQVTDPMIPKPPHFPGKAKHVIYLHMAGAPSQLDLFENKPTLAKFDGKPCPGAYLEGSDPCFVTANMAKAASG